MAVSKGNAQYFPFAPAKQILNLLLVVFFQGQGFATLATHTLETQAETRDAKIQCAQSNVREQWAKVVFVPRLGRTACKECTKMQSCPAVEWRVLVFTTNETCYRDACPCALRKEFRTMGSSGVNQKQITHSGLNK